MKLSIILPVYNVEEYLEECIESIFLQNIDEKIFEVIAVNDGSKDNSIKILKKYKEKYKNFYIINKANGGLSSARNEGLKASKGKYILFLDSDDYLLENTISKILQKAIIEDLDAVSFNYRSVYEDGKKVIERSKTFHNKVLDGLKYWELINKNQEFVRVVWLYIYKKEFLLKNNLFFNEKFLIHEDEEFFQRFLSYAKKIGSIDILTINYRRRSNSITTSKDKDFSKKRLNALILLLREGKKIENSANKKELSNGISYFAKEIIVLSKKLGLSLNKEEEKLIKHFIFNSNRCKYKMFYTYKKLKGLVLRGKHVI